MNVLLPVFHENLKSKSYFEACSKLCATEISDYGSVQVSVAESSWYYRDFNEQTCTTEELHKASQTQPLKRNNVNKIATHQLTYSCSIHMNVLLVLDVFIIHDITMNSSCTYKTN